MKKSKLGVFAAVCLCATIVFSSCIGSFRLTNNVLDWNKQVSRSKFVNELLFILFTPAYAVTSMADLIVINSVEFWSGSNPIASNKIKEVKGENGQTYLVKQTENGYNIYSEDTKENVQLTFDAQNQTWSMTANGVESKLFSFINENKVELYLTDGTTIEVDLNEDGLASLRSTLSEQYMIEVASL